MRQGILALAVGIVLGCAWNVAAKTPAPDALEMRMPTAWVTYVQAVPTLNWTIAAVPATANSYSYKAYINSATTGVVLVGVTCVAAQSGSTCSAPFPNPADGTYTVQLTALKTVGATVKESPKSASAALDIVTTPPTPGIPGCTGCAPVPTPTPTPTPVPLTVTLLTPAADATLSGVANVTFETSGSAVRSEATIYDATDTFICTCQAALMSTEPSGAKQWRVQLDTVKGSNAAHVVQVIAYDAAGASVQAPRRRVTFLN